MKKLNKLIFGIVMVAILIAFSVPASALDGPVALDQLNRFEEVVPNGGYWLDWDKNGATTVNFDVPNVNLYRAMIYNSAWMPPDLITATYPDASTPLPDRYPHIDDYTRYTGLGTCGVWYDVTGATIPGTTNTYSTSASGHGTALTILYQDPSNPNPLYSWLYQGYDDVDHTQGYVYYTFNNVPGSSATHWTLMMAVTCADNGEMKFNGVTLPDSGFNPGTKYYHIATHDVSNIIETGDNIVGFDAVNDDYTHPYFIWLVGTTPDEKPDLTIPSGGIVIGTPRPNNNFQVDATILNQGEANAVASSARLYDQDDNILDTKPVPALGIGASDVVEFDVNLPEGCYEFKVVADINGDVDESDENNNERAEYGQVGYVIVIESDSDFNDLLTSGMPAGSVTYYSGNNTYYIQDLTITNCAGDGIHITGTTKNFVIKDCTIENCAPDASGVFLNDVTMGTITECTLRNNEAYGIELGLVPLDPEDPENINIIGNTISQNGKTTNKSGIDLIGTDCTVACNHVIDNGAFGIYVYGDVNKIYNNMIENNDDYGIKLFSSSGNDLYRNDIINNGGAGAQAFDSGTTNTWNSPTPVDYCYSGTTYNNYVGNYWYDYTGSDSDGDGIGNTPYTLAGGATDSYSAMVKWRLCGDVNRNGAVNMGDVVAVRNHYVTGLLLNCCNC